MTDLYTSWQRVWRGLGARTDGTKLYEELQSRYSEPHRKYHTLQHLSECIAWFGTVSELAEHPAEVEAALWFHDAIYELDQHDNEERSAGLARDTLSQAGISSDSVYRIERLVLATRHREPPASHDEQLVVDIDLAIFAATEQRFAEYERQIREEYAIVPDDVFSQTRSGILCKFLARKRIYGSEYFRSTLEHRARTNLLRAIAANQR